MLTMIELKLNFENLKVNLNDIKVEVQVTLLDGFVKPKVTYVALNENEIFKNVRFEIKDREMFIYIQEKKDEMLDHIKKSAESKKPKITKPLTSEEINAIESGEPDPDLLENVFSVNNTFIDDRFEIDFQYTNYKIPENLLKKFPITKNSLVRIELGDKVYRRKVHVTGKKIPELLLHFTKEELEKIKRYSNLRLTYSCYKAKEKTGRIRWYGDLTYKNVIERCDDYTAKYNRFYYDVARDHDYMKNTMKDELKLQREQR